MRTTSLLVCAVIADPAGWYNPFPGAAARAAREAAQKKHFDAGHTHLHQFAKDVRTKTEEHRAHSHEEQVQKARHDLHGHHAIKAQPKHLKHAARHAEAKEEEDPRHHAAEAKEEDHRPHAADHRHHAHVQHKTTPNRQHVHLRHLRHHRPSKPHTQGKK